MVLTGHRAAPAGEVAFHPAGVFGVPDAVFLRMISAAAGKDGFQRVPT